ncbi:MAG: hypothetical protein NT066_07260 [Candidatus Omnitrophica bacterium]|nr:hypothetical protein [Candidatus Omnitrophota bacterium]
MRIQRFMDNVLIIFAMVIFVIGAFPMTATSEIQAGTVSDEKWDVYRDPESRFEFSYPANFGIPTPDIRVDMPDGDSGEMFFFPQFSHGFSNGKIVLEGDFVVRSGRVWVGAQALGGLYDPMTLSALIDTFPPALQEKLFEQARNLTNSNFCSELSKAEHITIDNPALVNLSSDRKQAVIELDRMRNLDPKVITCQILDDTVIFDKQVLAQFGKFSSIQHIYGAVRFLKGNFTSVQFIRITHEPPTEKLLETMTKVVQSFKPL